ncbi:hypothetical protein D1BOALGB6SA_1739 [Olavius sp. associated proteobacterium Delta 1]|nr:hypothetical protein D1BOALGB6SA_1739 [Olavius sp. associated proteobacterium Delta 1]
MFHFRIYWTTVALDELGAGLRQELKPNIACPRQSNRISKDYFAPGLRSLFGEVGLLRLYFKWTEYLTSTFDVHYSIFAFL